jgi:prepilin-type N-terminal cleavage/methylation domain-containing protein
MNRTKKASGFTIIEVIIVVVVLAILAAILIPNFRGIRTDSKTSSAMADLRTLQTAIEAYINERNSPPDALASLLLVSASDRVVNEVPTDAFSPSSADYQYTVQTSFNTTTLYVVNSVGPDGTDDITYTDLTDDTTLDTGETGDDIYVTNQRVE